MGGAVVDHRSDGGDDQPSPPPPVPSPLPPSPPPPPPPPPPDLLGLGRHIASSSWPEGRELSQRNAAGLAVGALAALLLARAYRRMRNRCGSCCLTHDEEVENASLLVADQARSDELARQLATGGLLEFPVGCLEWTLSEWFPCFFSLPPRARWPPAELPEMVEVVTDGGRPRRGRKLRSSLRKHLTTTPRNPPSPPPPGRASAVPLPPSRSPSASPTPASPPQEVGNSLLSPPLPPTAAPATQVAAQGAVRPTPTHIGSSVHSLQSSPAAPLAPPSTAAAAAAAGVENAAGSSWARVSSYTGVINVASSLAVSSAGAAASQGAPRPAPPHETQTLAPLAVPAASNGTTKPGQVKPSQVKSAAVPPGYRVQAPVPPAADEVTPPALPPAHPAKGPPAASHAQRPATQPAVPQRTGDPSIGAAPRGGAAEGAGAQGQQGAAQPAATAVAAPVAPAAPAAPTAPTALLEHRES